MSAIRRRRKRRNSLKVNYCIKLRASERERMKIFIEIFSLSSSLSDENLSMCLSGSETEEKSEEGQVIDSITSRT